MSPRHSRNRRTAGFTLIEILVVIVIVAVLASLVAPQVFRHLSDAKSNAAKSQIETLALALSAYRLDADEYPTTEQGLAALWAKPATGVPQHWNGPYLARMVPSDPWGRPYIYISPGRVNPGSYDLYTLGRDGVVDGADEDADITSWHGLVNGPMNGPTSTAASPSP